MFMTGFKKKAPLSLFGGADQSLLIMTGTFHCLFARHLDPLPFWVIPACLQQQISCCYGGRRYKKSSISKSLHPTSKISLPVKPDFFGSLYDMLNTFKSILTSSHCEGKRTISSKKTKKNTDEYVLFGKCYHHD